MAHGIAAQFREYKIYKMENEKLYIDGLYLTEAEALAFAEWIDSEFRQSDR